MLRTVQGILSSRLIEYCVSNTGILYNVEPSRKWAKVKKKVEKCAKGVEKCSKGVEKCGKEVEKCAQRELSIETVEKWER